MQLLPYFFLIIFLASCTTTRIHNQESMRVEPMQQNSSHKTATLKKANSCEHTAKAFNCVKVVDVYDGDTIFIDIPENHPFFGKRMGVRIFGIDTPELKSSDSCEKDKGQEAKSLLKALLHKAKRVDVIDIQKDKYFRVLGVVIADGKAVANDLIKHKLAYPYHGEKKPKRNWCD